MNNPHRGTEDTEDKATDLFGFKRRKRRKLRERPWPEGWSDILTRNVPHYGTLSDAQREQLHGHIQVFLAEKRFEGCGGLEMTDEIRVTIAAQACTLLLGRESDYYPKMKSIFVYPEHYFAAESRPQPGGIVGGRVSARAGESWYRGPVVLSWDDVRKGASDPNDGRNVVYHEFAHQLDSETGDHDGAPAMERRSMYIAWARVLGADYQKLIEDITGGRDTLLDAYGGTSPAEFFAVATEAFFEKPRALRRRHGKLYEQLKTFYRQDPAKQAER